jgi:hypothetical protein
MGRMRFECYVKFNFSVQCNLYIRDITYALDVIQLYNLYLKYDSIGFIFDAI